jgi:subtilase family serine protease
MGRKRVAKSSTIMAAVAATATMAGLVIAGAGGAAQAAPAPGPHLLAGSAVPFTSRSQPTGTVAGGRALTIQVWLKPRLAAAEAYATAVSTPGNALYRRHLSPSAYTARFGATAAEAQTAASWLRSQGFTGISTGAQRDYVRATGSVSAINTAFRTTMRYYKSSAGFSAGRYRLYANDSALTLPAPVAAVALGVTGLDNAAPILPLQRQVTFGKVTAAGPVNKCSGYYGQFTATANGATHPTLICGYYAKRLRAAYGANFTNTGKGQTIALVELGLSPAMFPTLQKYAAKMRMPAPDPARYQEALLGGSLAACGDPFFIEEQLDVEAAYDMAPGADEFVVGGNGCDTGDAGLQGLFDADLHVLNGNGGSPLATVASNSWESGAESQGALVTSIEHAYLVKAAAEGVGMYFSAGDGSGVLAPSSDPFAIAVGGTSLGIGQHSNRIFETGWSTNALINSNGSWIEAGEAGATGGGPSLLWRQPSYQKGIVPKALATPGAGNRGGLVRSAPDISADADSFTGMLITVPVLDQNNNVTGYQNISVGGTSLAAPLVAGIVTAGQQGQKKSFGYLDPAFYKLAKTRAFHDVLPLTSKTPAADKGVYCDPFYCGIPAILGFDDQSYSMPGYSGQVTLPGYDNMSGVGSPNGQSFIAALRKL